MNEESSARPEPSLPASTAPSAAAPAKKLPPWLPFLAFAVVPAAVVGILVYALAGGKSNDSAGAVLDGFFRQGSPSESIRSYQGKVPPDFPSEFPIYRGADVYASFIILGEQNRGANYFVILGTNATADAVYNYYLDRLARDPWQVEIARASTEFTGMRFTRPDDADVSGDVTIHHSELDKRTTIYVSYQDLTAAAAPEAPPFVLGKSRALPPNFPNDVAIYDAKTGDAVITDTYFERAPGGTSYIITFVTRDSQDDVISAYREEFEKKGWQVKDSTTANSGFQLGIDFTDGPNSLLQGSVLADVFEEDADYTKVDLLLQVSSNRSRGN